jgi:YVTN family beta-propeller protein
MNTRCLRGLIAIACFPLVSGPRASASDALAPRFREPVAIVWADQGKTVLVANRRSGSVSVIDAQARRVIAEFDVGRSLGDLRAVPASPLWLATDMAADQVVLFERRDTLIQVRQRLDVGGQPSRIAVASDGRSCVVASRWARSLTFVDLKAGDAHEKSPLSVLTAIDMPFCPGELAFFPDGRRLVVADAFGGKLAVVDCGRRSLESVRELPAHNIRGLAFSPDGRTLVLAHQFLNRLAHTRFDDVHWGDVIRNHLRVLRTDALTTPGGDQSLFRGARHFDLGDVGYAAGDPAGLAFDSRDGLVVALAGMNEIAITAIAEQGPRRVVVGRHPTCVAPSPDGSLVFVADSLDDTISVVSLATGQKLATISLGPRPELSAIDRGERLFFDAKLSHDGWMSCHSCHTDGHTNNLSSDTLSDGSFGAAKRVPSLLGVGATPPWTWTGTVDRLEDQVRKSITITMQGTKPTDEQVADLTAYLKALTIPKLRGKTGDRASIDRGRAVFQDRKCADCHAPPEFTTPERFDVGLTDEVGNRRFNPPSLRAVSRRETLLHDGRARSLAEVFEKERHPRGLVLSAPEIVDLVRFLESL